MGQGIKEDDSKAMAWFEKSAAQGNAAASQPTGLYACCGQGVAQNYQPLSSGIKKQPTSACQCTVQSCLMYANGIGTEKDPIKARALFETAAAQGFKPAKKALAAL